MQNHAPPARTPLQQRQIVWFWLPLAASWAFMTLEGPMIQAAIARLSDAKTMLAAAGIVISLEVTIESPVMMLLAASTALATSAQAYRTLGRYVLYLNILLTTVAALIAFADPVFYGLIPGVMGIPLHIAEVARPALQIMTLWTAAIGWRRFYQGILIRFGHTRQMAYGTAVRLLSGLAMAVCLVLFSDLPGIVVGGLTWMTGVFSELLYAWLAARPVIRANLIGPDAPSPRPRPPLTLQAIFKFHAPLAASSVLSLLAQPMISAGLARMAFPEENLAAWPIIFSVLLFFRSFGLALPEMIIALLHQSEALAPLRRFSFRVAMAASFALGVVAFSPALVVYLRYITSISNELIQVVIPGVLFGLALPALNAVQSWYRGVLMVGNSTGDVYRGMGLNLLATAVPLVVGVSLQTPGAPTAAIALTVGMVIEALYLWWRVRPLQLRIAHAAFEFA